MPKRDAVVTLRQQYLDVAARGKIYVEGRTAYRRGESESRCPFADEGLREAWMQGWSDARREHETR